MTRPITEERKKLEKRVRETMRRDCNSTVPDEWCIKTGLCSCQLMLDLLASERGMREALEKAQKTLQRASRELSENHRLVLQGKRWGGETLDAIDAALSGIEPGEEQARG